jgi:heat shock protein HtpX
MVLPRTDAINAFAAGWDAQDAVVAVTQGALDHLTREELQGMVAHELSHLHEGDTRLKMRLAGMVFGLELVYNFGEEMRERRGLAWWFGSAIMLAGWRAGSRAACSRPPFRASANTWPTPAPCSGRAAATAWAACCAR